MNRRHQREYGLLVLLVVMVIVVSIINHAFLSPGNLRDMLVKAAPVMIVACGLTLVIVTGEIDISVGSLMGLLAAVMGMMATRQSVAGAVGATLLLGAVTGFATGLLVTVGRVPSIIVTLGMLTALRGTTDLLMGGKWITNLPAGLRVLGTNPVIIIGTAAVVVALFVVLTQLTPLGRRIYAVGSNPHSAMLAGISERRIKIAVFTLTGLLTGVATLVSVPQLSVIEAGVGNGFELLVVTSVVVGGTSISGGRGSIAGSALGVLLLSTVGTVLIFLRLGERSTYWERAIQGAFILLAVLVDHVARRRERRG